MSRSDLMTCFCIALALMLATLLGLYYLVGLYLTQKIGSYGVEPDGFCSRSSPAPWSASH